MLVSAATLQAGFVTNMTVSVAAACAAQTVSTTELQ
jgi:hypothetical protein